MNRSPRKLTQTWLVAGFVVCAWPSAGQVSPDAPPELPPVDTAPQPEQPAPDLPPLSPDALPAPTALTELLAPQQQPAFPAQRTIDALLAEVDLPEPITDPQALADPPLAEALGNMLDQAEQATAEGRYFDAITTLREAHRLAPTHPRVLRALGLAYANSGNTVRGLGYLETYIRHAPTDREVLLILARHALQRGDHGLTLGWTRALADAAQAEPASDDTAWLADYFRARVFQATGQADAAIELYRRVLSYQPKHDAGPAVQREWFILTRQRSELYLQLGDLLLRRGQVEPAAQAYQLIDPQALAPGSGYVSRLVYCDLLQRDPASAIDHTAAFLASATAQLDDAKLIDYLLAQGVDRDALEAAMDQRFDAQSAPIPMLAGLARLKPLDQTLALTRRLMDQRSVSPADYSALLAVLDNDGAVLSDPRALAGVALLTAHAMAQQPAQARAYVQVLLDLRPDPVSLIRALRQPELAEAENPWAHYLAGLAFTQVERLDLAEAALQRAMELDESLVAARFELARLIAQPELSLAEQNEEALVNSATLDRAAALIAQADASSDWPIFQLLVQIEHARNNYSAVRSLLSQRVQRMGLDPEFRVFRITMLVRSRSYSTEIAVGELIKLIEERPEYEPAYAAALDLIDNYQVNDRFNRPNNLPALRQRIVADLIRNLPQSRSALLEQLYDVWRVPEQNEAAEYLLQQMLELDPQDQTALYFLAQHYRDLNQPDKARAFERRYIEAYSPGLYQRALLAEFELDAGNQLAVAQLIQRTLAEEEEGVMPGPALDGQMAAILLAVLSRANQEEIAEPLYLKMVRRFPQNGQLNNAMGYRWAMAGHNLIQARNMIQRAIDAEGENSSYLDSMAWVHYKMGDFAKAEAYQSQALAVLRQEQLATGEPYRATKAVLSDHMGDILYQNGDVPGAITKWQYARAQRLTDEDLASDPELQTLGERVRAKIAAALEGAPVPVADVPGEAAFGPEGHPADEVPAQ